MRAPLLLLLGLLSALPGCASPCSGTWGGDLDGDGLADVNDPDKDGDGIPAEENDCDDCDPGIGPNVADTTYDGVDQDCDSYDAWLVAPPEQGGYRLCKLGDPARLEPICTQMEAAHRAELERRAAMSGQGAQ